MVTNAHAAEKARLLAEQQAAAERAKAAAEEAERQRQADGASGGHGSGN